MNARPRSTKKTILVIDDSKIVHTLMKLGLRRLPAELKFAFDGVEALAMIEQSPPDLLLVDLMMPRMDGMSLLAALDANESLRAIPRIVVTAKTDVRLDRKRFDGANTAFLSKPISLDTLRSLIDEALASGEFASQRATTT